MCMTILLQVRTYYFADQQEEVWIAAQTVDCEGTCTGEYTSCMCGAKVGQYSCGCAPGYERIGAKCEGGYKYYLQSYCLQAE